MRLKNICSFTGILASILLSSGLASASTIFSFAGTFSQDDHLETFSFSIPTSTTVTIRSYGYAGGTNGNSQVIARGGLDSFFSVFDSAGTLKQTNDDVPGISPVDPATSNAFDAIIQQVFAAGTYTLVLSQTDNTPLGGLLSDGFSQTGNGAYTCAEFAGTSGPFCDAGGDQRNGNWALDISGVATASDTTSGVPEPASILLVGSAATAFVLRRRKSSNSQS
jgi:hypothetical protein